MTRQRWSKLTENNRNLPFVSIIVPCYNEQDVLRDSIGLLVERLSRLVAERYVSDNSFVLFVDDGSRDSTWDIISQYHKLNKSVRGIKLSANFGHQNALLAGLLTAKNSVDCVISIDADMQQDIEIMTEFIDRFKSGVDIVFGVRKDRLTDNYFKKMSAQLFYKVMHWLGVIIIKNHADYRLVSRRALDALAEYRGYNLFLRGIFVNMGFRQETVYFDVKPRLAGNTKYSLSKMLSMALKAITSFSVVPLRLVTVTGFSIFLLSICMTLYVFYISFFTSVAVPGWASTVIPIYFLGGIQLLGIGVIGEYIGKSYQEIKGRPRFIKEEELF